MRTTLNIDDRLLEDVQRLTGISEKTALVEEGLRALIERESSRDLSHTNRLPAGLPELP